MAHKNLEDYSKKLKLILNTEILSGNEIAETSTGWPFRNSIVVILKKPFIRKYTIQHLDYREIDDPHYWKSEYFDTQTNHLLACRF